MKQYNFCRSAFAAFVTGGLLCSLAGCGSGTSGSGASFDPQLSLSSSQIHTNVSSNLASSALTPSLSEAGSRSAQSSSPTPPLTTIEPTAPPTSSAPSAAGTRDSTARVLTPSADGTTVLGNSLAQIDASNLAEGYVMVCYLGSNSNVKLQLTKEGGSTYTYNLSTSGRYETFPLSAGSGKYSLNIYENVSGNQYALACAESLQVSLQSSLRPFLYPNQYVNFSPGSSTIELGSKLAGSAANDLEVVEKIYNYVVNNISYDFDKAATATSGYLPDVDNIVSSGKGICFDYAAVMTTMLRTQRIPTKLVVGYSGSIYHAWISVYITDIGWVNDIIYFDGKTWVRMDPTFASSAKSSPDIMKYIGNGSNYNAMFVY